MDRHNCTDTISNVMPGAALTSALSLSWRGWLGDGKKLLAAEIKRTLTTVKVWKHRAHSRRQLRQLDERLCRDIGITTAQLRDEATKPFWTE